MYFFLGGGEWGGCLQRKLFLGFTYSLICPFPLPLPDEEANNFGLRGGVGLVSAVTPGTSEPESLKDERTFQFVVIHPRIQL